MTAEDIQRRSDLGCDIMLEGMAAIRNISGALRAWDLKEDAQRLKAINSIAEALYTFDIRSEVAMGVTRDTLRRLCAEMPELAGMCPVAAAWADGSGQVD
ncbi:hypothetical protein [Cereibacter changlensis]|nr:hypothetical protein [Cereibacter changlensis]PZX50314.1 hypothetical protein LX76_03461 [Cereibacter changlensis]